MAGRILIVEEQTIGRIALRACLAAAAHDVDISADATQTIRAARAARPDLVLIGSGVASEDMAELCRGLRASPGCGALPVVLLASHHTRDSRIVALRAGIDAVIDREAPADMLLARIRSLLRRHAAHRELLRDQSAAGAYGMAEPAAPEFTRPGRVSLIAPSLAAGMRWRATLRPLLRDRIEVLDPAGALGELTRAVPSDAIVIAADMEPRGTALRLLADLRSRDESQRAAILLVQNRPNPDIGALALDLGVDELVDTGFDAAEMALRLRRNLARKAQADRARDALQVGLRLAVMDPLTGLHNRRYAMPELDRLVKRSAQTGESFAVMMLDLDRFKRINDRLGHPAGDAVLAECARRMAPCLREGDLLARIGGEEFLAVIRRCDSVAAACAAERLRESVSARPVALPGGAEVPVTLSIGLVLAGGQDAPQYAPAQLIELADKALYMAKAEGRNQVTMHRTAA